MLIFIHIGDVQKVLGIYNNYTAFKSTSGTFGISIHI